MAQESRLQNRILADAKSRQLQGQPLWMQKINDRVTAGIPDILGCVAGRFLAAELKSPGKTATSLQALFLKRIREAGGRAEVIDDFNDWTRIIEDLLEKDAA